MVLVMADPFTQVAVKSWLHDNWFKAGILLLPFIVVVLASYYYLVTVPRIQAVQQDQIQQQNSFVSIMRGQCATEAEQSAVLVYEHGPDCTGSDADASCHDGITYLVPQYNNAFRICLEKAGL
jgi:hypothetical protein